MQLERIITCIWLDRFWVIRIPWWRIIGWSCSSHGTTGTAELSLFRSYTQRETMTIEDSKYIWASRSSLCWSSHISYTMYTNKKTSGPGPKTSDHPKKKQYGCWIVSGQSWWCRNVSTNNIFLGLHPKRCTLWKKVIIPKKTYSSRTSGTITFWWFGFTFYIHFFFLWTSERLKEKKKYIETWAI